MIGSMTDVVGDLLPYAVGVALSPVPLIAVFLLLGAPAGRAAGALFVLARVVTLAVVVVLAAALADLLPESRGPSLAGAVLRILLGAALMVWAVVQVVRPDGARADSDKPGWMASMGKASPAGAARIGVLLSAANLKELALGLGAGLTVASEDLAPGAVVGVAVAYAVLACLGTIVAVAAFWLAEDRVSRPLDRARVWLVRNSVVLVAIVLLVIGAVLAGGGVRDL